MSKKSRNLFLILTFIIISFNTNTFAVISPEGGGVKPISLLDTCNHSYGMQHIKYEILAKKHIIHEVCRACGKSFERSAEHMFINGKCFVCGTEQENKKPVSNGNGTTSTHKCEREEITDITDRTHRIDIDCSVCGTYGKYIIRYHELENDICTVCEYTKVDEHTCVLEKKANCEESGRCIKCKKIIEKPTGHMWVRGEYEYVSTLLHRVRIYCSNCKQEKYLDECHIHIEDKCTKCNGAKHRHTVTSVATCVEAAVCKECGSYGNPLGHNLIFEKVDNEFHKYNCTRCEEYKDIEKHNFNKNNKCTKCGYIAKEVEEITGNYNPEKMGKTDRMWIKKGVTDSKEIVIYIPGDGGLSNDNSKDHYYNYGAGAGKATSKDVITYNQRKVDATMIEKALYEHYGVENVVEFNEAGYTLDFAAFSRGCPYAVSIANDLIERGFIIKNVVLVDPARETNDQYSKHKTETELTDMMAKKNSNVNLMLVASDDIGRFVDDDARRYADYFGKIYPDRVSGITITGTTHDTILSSKGGMEILDGLAN